MCGLQAQQTLARHRLSPGSAACWRMTTLCSGLRQRKEGQALMDRESELFEAQVGRRGGQDAQWLQQARHSGTTADKVAAHSLVIQVLLPTHAHAAGCLKH